MNIKNELAKIQNAALTDPRFKHSTEDMEITDRALDGVDKLFNSILPHFPAWRQSCPTDDDLGRLKLVWTKALMRNKHETGKNINLKAGIAACEKSDSDWLPSVGKFIKWCDQSDDILPLAQKALDLFNSGQKQIETVGREVVKKHGFDLKLMKAADSNKKFIELYFMIAADNPIEPLESHLLAESVQLTKEQQKDAENRAAVARDSFLNQFSSLIAEKPKKEVKQSQAGLKTESLKVRHKSQKELDESRRLQLQQIKGKLK